MSSSTHTLPLLSDCSDLAGKEVIVRAGLNVPIDARGRVENTFRIRRTLATLQFLQARGAKTVVIAHIGRDASDTLRPVYEALAESITIGWCGEVVGQSAQQARRALKNGEILLLENVRAHEGERTNDPTFTKALAGSADYYVNDAFSASHRPHASIIGLPRYLPSYFGLQFAAEVQGLDVALVPPAPALLVLGGAKFATKLPLLKKYLTVCDHVFVGGALAHDIWRARGYELGASLVSDNPLTDEEILDADNVLLPIDVTVAEGGTRRVTTPDDVRTTETILDAGPETLSMLAPYIDASRTIIWNGPLGNYEKGYRMGTEALAEQIANSLAHSIVGGGDTIAAIATHALESRFDFLSTGGGAMLTYLTEGSLPAIDVVTGS